MIRLRNAISDILQEAYEDTLAEIESERANLTYSDVVDSVGGHVSYNAFQLISHVLRLQAGMTMPKSAWLTPKNRYKRTQTEYYTYTTSEEVRTSRCRKRFAGRP